MKTKRLLGCFLAIIMFWTVGINAYAAGEEKISGTNWMSAIDSNKLITQLNIPGTHDSATMNADFNAVSKTQSLSIDGQLYAGVRFFDIRLKKTKDTFLSVHGIAKNRKDVGWFGEKMTADDIVASFKAFLEKNSAETILLLLKEEESNTKEEFYSSFYEKYIENAIDLWYVRNDHIPTLGECRGKIVVLRNTVVDAERFDNTNGAIDFTNYPYVATTDTIDFRTCEVQLIEKTDEADEAAEATSYAGIYVQDSYKLHPSKKITAISTFLSQKHNSSWFNICVTSSGANLSPYYNAMLINKELMEYPFEKGEVYGIVSVDFANAELCAKIYGTNKLDNTPSASTEMPQEEVYYAFLGRIIGWARAILYKTIDLFV